MSLKSEGPSSAENTIDPFLRLESGATEVYLIRHANALPSTHEVAKGGYDAQALSELGRRQSMALADRMRKVSVAAIHSSPIKRTWQTATFVGEALGLEMHTSEELREVDLPMPSHLRGLPTKVAQAVVKQVHEAWVSFFEACKEYREYPEKFTGRPKLPKYKDKTSGRNLLTYNMQAVSRGKRTLDRGKILPSQLGITVKTRQSPSSINEVRIVPKKGFYVVEVVYTKEEKQEQLNDKYIAGIDLGVNNLIALTSNKPGFVPVVVNGRPVKSTNQFYNKKRAEYQKASGKTGSTRKMERLTNKRNRRIEHYQNFVQIQHAKLISMLTYKAELVGITVKLTEESYTSQASFLDRDKVPKYDPNRKEKPRFSGKRVKRGLYRASDGRLINADIQGSANIIRKVAPKAFDVEGGKARFSHALVVHPVRLVIPRRNKKVKS